MPMVVACETCGAPMMSEAVALHGRWYCEAHALERAWESYDGGRFTLAERMESIDLLRADLDAQSLVIHRKLAAKVAP